MKTLNNETLNENIAQANADVYILLSQYKEGRKFEEDVMVKAYKTYAQALEAFNADKDEVIETFLCEYDDDDIEIEESEDNVIISANNYDDCNELTILPLRFQ